MAERPAGRCGRKMPPQEDRQLGRHNMLPRCNPRAWLPRLLIAQPGEGADT